MMEKSRFALTVTTGLLALGGAGGADALAGDLPVAGVTAIPHLSPPNYWFNSFELEIKYKVPVAPADTIPNSLASFGLSGWGLGAMTYLAHPNGQQHRGPIQIAVGFSTEVPGGYTYLGPDNSGSGLQSGIPPQFPTGLGFYYELDHYGIGLHAEQFMPGNPLDDGGFVGVTIHQTVSIVGNYFSDQVMMLGGYGLSVPWAPELAVRGELASIEGIGAFADSLADGVEIHQTQRGPAYLLKNFDGDITDLSSADLAAAPPFLNVPEPASLGLLAAAGGSLLLRRRRN